MFTLLSKPSRRMYEIDYACSCFEGVHSPFTSGNHVQNSPGVSGSSFPRWRSIVYPLYRSNTNAVSVVTVVMTPHAGRGFWASVGVSRTTIRRQFHHTTNDPYGSKVLLREKVSKQGMINLSYTRLYISWLHGVASIRERRNTHGVWWSVWSAGMARGGALDHTGLHQDDASKVPAAHHAFFDFAEPDPCGASEAPWFDGRL